MFKINDKVVCVDASRGVQTGELWLIKGSTYAVIGLHPSGAGVYVAGDPNSNRAWLSDRFRLVSEVRAEKQAARKATL